MKQLTQNILKKNSMKLLNLLLILFAVQISFSQDLSSVYSDISEHCGADIASKFQEKNKEIKENLNGKNDLKLAITPIKNSLQEYTEISEKLSPKIQNVFQQKVKSQFSMFNTITIDYVEDKNKLSKYDYILSANYFIQNGVFTIDNINLKKPDNSLPIALEKSEIPINTTMLQTKDYALISDNINQLSRSLTIQYKNLGGLKKVKLHTFKNLSNNEVTEFSLHLATYLESDFVKIAGFEVLKNTRSLDATVQYIISGSYTIEEDKIKVTSILKDPDTDITIGTATAYLRTNFLTQNNIEYENKNEPILEQRLEALEETSVVNDFEIDVWTNKGNNNPIFREKEKMQISLKVNEVCYIRVIDIFADGTEVLLVDNFKIESYNVNKDYTIPITFECSEPFGAETIIVMAQTGKPFPHINTVDYYGSKKIIDDISSYRGFVPSVRKAEKYINVWAKPR